jgi:NADPH:quinone reductase
MRAIVYSEAGSTSVLRLVERPVLEPGAGEIRLRIAVSGVNPTDWKSRSRRAPVAESVPHHDGAGLVDAVGAGVHHFAPGDRVWMHAAAYRRASGTAQEYAVLPEGLVAALPPDASFDVGASLGVPALTAHRALTAHESAPKALAPETLQGRRVLISGGAGAVSHAAIQLARWAGATVITTVSDDVKATLARAAGAHVVIDYRRSDAGMRVLEAAPTGVDIVVEVAPGTNRALNAAVLADGGVVAVYANAGFEPLELDFGAYLARNARYQFISVFAMPEDAILATIDAVGAALIDGALAVGESAGLPLRRFGLADTAAAHDAVESGTVGKVLIDVDIACSANLVTRNKSVTQTNRS